MAILYLEGMTNSMGLVSHKNVDGGIENDVGPTRLTQFLAGTEKHRITICSESWQEIVDLIREHHPELLKAKKGGK